MLAVLLILGGLQACTTSPSKSTHMQLANDIIAKAEEYRAQHGQVPEGLSALGIEEKEEGPVYYEKRSDTQFVVWYGTTLGESMVWDSDVKAWKEG